MACHQARVGEGEVGEPEGAAQPQPEPLQVAVADRLLVRAGDDLLRAAAEEARRGIATLFDRARTSGALAAQAEEIQPAAASAAWLTFVAMLLSLAASVAGAMLGRNRAAEAASAAAP